MNVKLLDCTLRDGSHVNGGDFSVPTIKNVVNALNKSKVDIIELGFLKNTETKKGSTLFGRLSDAELMLDGEVSSDVSLMIRPDWLDINTFNRSSDKIDLIRFAFNNNHLELTKEYIEKALSYGYKVALNPINVCSYSFHDLKKILREVSNYDIDTISLVDTFGSLKKKTFVELCKIFEGELSHEVSLGIHLHENMSQTFGLVSDYLEFGNPDRDIVIDSSLLGMGRIPGNLCTEIIMSHMISEGCDYLMNPILGVISKEIEPIKAKISWGYSPAYLLTAEKNIHRSYAEYLVNRSVDYHLCNDVLDIVAAQGLGEQYNEPAISEILNNYLSGTSK